MYFPHPAIPRCPQISLISSVSVHPLALKESSCFAQMQVNAPPAKLPLAVSMLSVVFSLSGMAICFCIVSWCCAGEGTQSGAPPQPHTYLYSTCTASGVLGTIQALRCKASTSQHTFVFPVSFSAIFCDLPLKFAFLQQTCISCP